MVDRKTLRWGLIFGILILIVILYIIFDPAQSKWFPKCFFKMATGLECPGCGSQRAIHRLFHLDIAGAMRQNVLLVIAIPYLIVAAILDNTRNQGPRMTKWRNALLSPTAIWIVFALVVIFWIARNLPQLSDYL